MNLCNGWYRILGVLEKVMNYEMSAKLTINECSYRSYRIRIGSIQALWVGDFCSSDVELALEDLDALVLGHFEEGVVLYFRRDFILSDFPFQLNYLLR